MQQLHGNGKLIIYNSRNVHGVTSSRMALSIVAGPRIRLTAQTTLDPDFVSIFEVNDAVELRDWVQTNGTSINTGYFKVVAVVHHTTLPSYIELGPYSGQTISGIVATAGNAFAPATIRRVDNVLFAEAGITAYTSPASGITPRTTLTATSSTNWRVAGLFGMGDKLIIANAGAAVLHHLVELQSGPTGFTGRFRPLGVNTLNIANGTYGASATNPPRIEFAQDNGYTTGIFPNGFQPSAYFYNGSDTQSPSSLVIADEGTGNVPGYRGVAYQGFDDFFATQFGDSLPYSMEAIIDVDQLMDWG